MAEVPAIPVTPQVPVDQMVQPAKVVAPQVGLPNSAAVNTTSQTPVVQPTVGPVTAADVDVIEKEWVDKAEEVIAKNAGDPHAEEEAIEDLQIDYLKKRYGKDVAKSD